MARLRKARRNASLIASAMAVSVASMTVTPAVHAVEIKSGGEGGPPPPAFHASVCDVGVRRIPASEAKALLQATIASATNAYRGEVEAAQKVRRDAERAAKNTFEAAVTAAHGDKSAKANAETLLFDANTTADGVYASNVESAIVKYEQATDAAYAAFYASTAANVSEVAARSACRVAVATAGANYRTAVRAAQNGYLTTVKEVRAKYGAVLSSPTATVEQKAAARASYRTDVKAARTALDANIHSARGTYENSLRAARIALKAALPLDAGAH